MLINRRILIVDDEPFNVLGLQIILRQCGYPQINQYVDCANNGQQAIEKVM